MHKLQNGSQVSVRPPRKPLVGLGGYFSESNDQGAPSYPGQDFFNDCIDEFTNALSAANITFVPGALTHLQKLLAKASSSFPAYDPDTVYSYGDVVYKTIGGVEKIFQWYSNVESLAGKDPELAANRRAGWSDTTKPFYWLPYSPKLSGETIYWDSDTIPENMVVGIGQQLPIAVYHTLAAAKPEWIDGIDPSLINVPDRQGRFSRAANGTTWIAGQTHEDAFQGHDVATAALYLHHTGLAGNVPYYNNGGGITPNSSRWDATTSSSDSDSITRAYIVEDLAGSGVPRIADETRPKAFIEWVGYAL